MIVRTMENLARRGLDVIRARPGAREVQDSADHLRGGNHLYLWQWAFLERKIGHRAYVKRSTSMSEWTQEFALLDALTIDPGDIRRFDARSFGTRFTFDLDFTRDQNDAFCRAMVASSDGFRERLERTKDLMDEDTCVINVRRGDYYSVDAFARRFGIDIPHHIDEALAHLEAMGRPTEDLLIVSDDVDWCRRELAGVVAGRMRVNPARVSMFDDLAVLASARTLVLANSTFSYWGSYIARSRIPDHLAIAPSHHELLADGTAIAPMNDPLWPRTSYRRWHP
ncbi:alpha-1,2-fucosyltransferase [Brachybacterium phenoliresistens]|uniref:alpha-1,2-fucosyltransferase n=1 Tax=Brachybacterium phenoliresistens TaxID=396014 RepID=UPI0031D093A3